MASTLVLLRLLSLFWVGTLLLSSSFQVLAQDSLQGTCCKKTSPAPIKTEISKCIIHSKTERCVAAVIFFSKGNSSYCSSPRARWVRAKVKELEKEGRPCLNWRNNITAVDM